MNHLAYSAAVTDAVGNLNNFLVVDVRDTSGPSSHNTSLGAGHYSKSSHIVISRNQEFFQSPSENERTKARSQASRSAETSAEGTVMFAETGTQTRENEDLGSHEKAADETQGRGSSRGKAEKVDINLVHTTQHASSSTPSDRAVHDVYEGSLYTLDPEASQDTDFSLPVKAADVEKQPHKRLSCLIQPAQISHEQDFWASCANYVGTCMLKSSRERSRGVSDSKGTGSL